MDFKDFKKVAEDDKTATLAHPKGHKIQIVKGTLSKPLQQQLSKLPLHQNSPQDVVPDAASTDTTDTAAPSPQDQIAPGTLQDFMGAIPATTPPPAPTTQMPQATASGVPDPNAEDAYTKAMQGNAQAAGAVSAGAKREADILGNSIDSQQAAAKTFQDTSLSMAHEINNARKDIAAHYINPNAYMQGLGTGGRIATAIGLILGGAGGGITGQGNPALAVLNQQIDRNLEAQRSNLGARENLLSALGKQYENQTVRDNMFRMINAHVVSDQLLQSAAQTKSPLAMANAKTAASELEMKYLPVFRQSAAIQALDASDAAGKPLPPANQIQLKTMTGLISPADSEKATDSLNSVQQLEELRGNLKQGYQDLHNRFMNGALSPAYRKSIVDRFAGPLGHLSTGRYNQEEAANQIGSILPGILEGEETSKSKLTGIDTLVDTLQAAHTAKLNQLGIKVPQKASTLVQPKTPQTTEAAQQWLAANPNHPQAAAVKAALAKRK
jgi:hypothetical protein